MSDKLIGYIELFHNTGVFIPTKTIRVVGDVNEDMFKDLLANLHSLDSTHGEITIKLMTDGGAISVARGIYDIIRGCKNVVRIICYGEVSSCGSIILQAADRRIMSNNSKLMIHVGEEGIPQGHPRNVDRLYKQHRLDEKWMEDIYLSRIKEKRKRFTRQGLRSMLVWDKSFNPKEALELGLIDAVGEEQ